jgi:hypothetical protein
MDKNGVPSTVKSELYNIPLYTHPAKTLTDEEMYELLEKYQGIELCKAVLRKRVRNNGCC